MLAHLKQNGSWDSHTRLAQVRYNNARNNQYILCSFLFFATKAWPVLQVCKTWNPQNSCSSAWCKDGFHVTGRSGWITSSWVSSWLEPRMWPPPPPLS